MMKKPDSKGYLIRATEPNNLDPRLTHIAQSNDLPQSGCQFVIFDFEHPEINKALILSLRKQSPYRYIAFFSWDAPPEDMQLLLDGQFNEASFQKASDIRERLSICLANDEHNQVDSDEENQFDIQLILSRYLFVRKKYALKAELTYENPYGFFYPIMEALFDSGTVNDHWYVLLSIVKREYLSEIETSGELQTCPSCEAGLLNFKNCCPNCESVDLHIEPFVHCFTCGNVGPVREFMRHQNLVCNRCQTQLKHIGIDYDKPLEDKICDKCQHRFFEPNTLYMCLVCESVGLPEALNTRKLNTYQLTQKGKAFARNDLKQLAIDIGEFFELINFKMMQFIIQWQAKVSERHQDIEFIVGVIYVDNLNELVEDIGFLRSEQILVSFYEKTRGLFRKTDLVSVDDDKLYCVLYKTKAEHQEVIEKRIQSFSVDGEDKTKELAVRYGFLTSKAIVEGELTQEMLVNELLNQVNS